MALAQAWYVVCDWCGDPGPVATESALQARKTAREEAGFLFYQGLDACARCRRDPRATNVRRKLGIPEPDATGTQMADY